MADKRRVADPKKHQVITVLTTTDKKRLDRLCAAWSMSVSETARRIIQDRLSSEEVGTATPPSGQLIDRDGFTYDSTLVPEVSGE